MEEYQNKFQILAKKLLTLISVSTLSIVPAAAECGMVDAAGNTILPFKYLEIQDAGSGFYVARESAESTVQEKGLLKYHVFDAHGNEFPFDQKFFDKLNLITSPPSNLPNGVKASYGNSAKYFMIHNEEGLQGYCDRNGKIILPCKYAQVRELEGEKFLARNVLYAQNPDCIYDEHGKLLFELTNWSGDSCQGYSCGLMRVSDSKTGKIGFIDEAGKVVIPPGTYDTEFGFTEADRLCSVKLHVDNSESCGFIDTTGKLVIGPFPNSVALPFQGGLAVISKTVENETVYGAINRDGKFVVPLEYSQVSTLGKGFVQAVKKKDSRVQIFDSEGKCVFCLPAGLRPQWGSDFDFGKTELVPVSMQLPDTFSNRTQRTLTGFCDKQGKVVIKPQFAHAFPFVGKYSATIAENELGERTFGVIDKTGKVVIPATKKTIVVLPGERFAVWEAPPVGDIASRWRDQSKWGGKLLNETLKKYDLIGMKFSEIQKIMGAGCSFEPKQDLPKSICKRRLYLLSGGGGCGNSRQDFELGFDKNDVVVGWTLCNFSGSGNSWIMENVVWVNLDSGLDTRFLVPKSHLEAISKFK